jgi:hypothetical protein
MASVRHKKVCMGGSAVRLLASRWPVRILIGAGVLLLAAPVRGDVSAEAADPAGDTVNEENDSRLDVPEADVLRSSISVVDKGIRLNVQVRKPTDPLTNRAWAGDESDTGIEWELETTGDDKPDFSVEYYTDSGKITGEVTRSSDNDDEPTLCELRSAAFSADAGYTAVVDTDCIRSPGSVAYVVTFSYDTDSTQANAAVAEDHAPDSGMSPRVGGS